MIASTDLIRMENEGAEVRSTSWLMCAGSTKQCVLAQVMAKVLCAVPMIRRCGQECRLPRR